MKKIGNLDTEVVKVLKMFPENGARWSQIRNALLIENTDIDRVDINILNVQLSRSLKRLQKDCYVTKEDQGHQKVIYKLTSKYKQEPEVFPILFGAFNPLDEEVPSYKEFKKTLVEALHGRQGEYVEEYEEFKKNWESFQNIRNLKRKG